eukprot:CAMPEP_0198205742 /NCGR_PEP_ID=MMETSP1445-20131203/9272_1 /TAXON_ID=36898 /ORGANISM="Pyramimonas sp., Strain CCMP2087" /LENGTH=38 /DNA_ID= /DNA_START= /DNA_END= /DNA_ORIENTATION=
MTRACSKQATMDRSVVACLSRIAFFTQPRVAEMGCKGG